MSIYQEVINKIPLLSIDEKREVKNLISKELFALYNSDNTDRAYTRNPVCLRCGRQAVVKKNQLFYQCKSCNFEFPTERHGELKVKLQEESKNKEVNLPEQKPTLKKTKKAIGSVKAK